MASTGEAWRLGRRAHVGSGSIGGRFDADPNALHFLRLCLALEVVVWHAYALRGSDWLPDQVRDLIAGIAVDGFFAISGFLILRGWGRRPHLARFLVARARRILPGLWACLLVTAFLIAPAASALAGAPAPSAAGQWRYVLGNAMTWPTEWGIDGQPGPVPVSGAWDGSLWSLGYETLCYLAVAVAGALRLLGRRGVVTAALALWTLTAATSLLGVGAGANNIYALLLRTGLMFACGGALFVLRERVPASPSLAWAAGLALGVAVFLPNYRLAAPAVAYLCIYGGLALGRFPRLVLRHDLSYGSYVYSFPIQQALLLGGVSLGWFGFAALSIALTLPMAGLSWFLVERPCLGARRRREQGRAQPANENGPAPQARVQAADLAL